MKGIKITILICLGLSELFSAQLPTYKFSGGNWFDGEKFKKVTAYSSNGLLTFTEPAIIDSVIDLGGGYVIPPFGEAHTHLLSQPGEFEKQDAMFLGDGVFYAMNQDPIFTLSDDILNQVKRPETVDVIYTRGVVTASWNIIAGLYQMFGEQGMFGEKLKLEELDTNHLFLIDSQEDLRNKWPILANKNPDFIKIIIAFTEEQEKRKNNPSDYSYQIGSYSKTPGIDPHLLPELVRRAHQAGLRTSVHIETAADFNVAVNSGTDFIAHLPASWQIGKEKTGFDKLDIWLIKEEDARKAAKQNIKVITTAYPPPDTVNFEQYARVHKSNISLLKKQGVSLVLGSDLFDKTIQAEALYLSKLNVLDNATLLNLLTRDTPKAIFPERKVG